ncbi:hypothetical protein BN1723_011667 [Verticillium longisporum]|uniref:Uncharacterized protein n=1 Tax=Verticillium longisporum TaxID=100787 RepID=A0A0G4L9K2_VERLO|nr:hypothetical protein BN1723_011667 [Verticillium longisporum]
MEALGTGMTISVDGVPFARGSGTPVVDPKESAIAKKEAAAVKKKEAEQKKAADKAAKAPAAKEKKVADAEARFRKAQQELRRAVGSPVTPVVDPEVSSEAGEPDPSPTPASKTPVHKTPVGPKGGSAKRSAPAPASGRPGKKTRSTPKKVVQIVPLLRLVELW